jgi:hypothetical protein
MYFFSLFRDTITKQHLSERKKNSRKMNCGGTEVDSDHVRHFANVISLSLHNNFKR